MKKSKLMLAIVPSYLFLSYSNAAEFIKIDENYFKKNFIANQKSITSHSNETKFNRINSVQLPNAVIKNKYIQYYHQIPVYGSILTESEQNGLRSQHWGRYLVDIQNDIKNVKPKLTSDEAITKAKQILKIYAQTMTELEQAQLYIKLNSENEAQLVYLVSLNITGANPKRPHMFLDAITGELIHQWEGLTTNDAKGPGGNEKTGKYYYGKDYSPLDVSNDCMMKNTHVVTYNLNGATSGGKVFQFTCPENTFKAINGAYSPINDAHYFGGVVYDMYKSWYNMDPINMILKMRVHYGKEYENAYWDGQQMTFGDGGQYLYPLTVLDVTAHEISHGVTEANSNLAYEAQSGGINEAFSDMAGETAEYFMKNKVGQENDWLVGGTVLKGPAGTALRYFKDPTQDGSSIDNAKDYSDSLDVHYSSGVFNKAFYNIAISSSDWGVRKAFEVFLLANRIYWASNATFDEAACGVAKAATDLKYDASLVVSSFKAVGVNASCDDDPSPPPSSEEIELKNDQPVTGIKIDQDKEVRYFIKVPTLKSYPYIYKFLRVRLYSATANAKEFGELFVRYDSDRPITQENLTTKDEIFNIPYPPPGYYHILIKGKKAGTLNLDVNYAK